MELTSEMTMLTYDEAFLERYFNAVRKVSRGGYTENSERYSGYSEQATGNAFVIEYLNESDEYNDE